jgi:NADH-quinone oxidoreductase subunit N
MFMRPVPEGAHTLERNWATELTLVLTTAAVVVLGILPGSITEWLTQAGSLFGGQ